MAETLIFWSTDPKPEMNGRDLAARLLATRPEIKCLYMSGYTADVIAHQGVIEEGVHFVQKPFSMSDLAAKIREALGKVSFQPWPVEASS